MEIINNLVDLEFMNKVSRDVKIYFMSNANVTRWQGGYKIDGETR